MRIVQQPQIDMQKVMLAAARIMAKKEAEEQARRDKIILFETATANIREKPKPLPKFSIPADSASRRYQRQIRKGCCGFNHHHFQHGS